MFKLDSRLIPIIDFHFRAGAELLFRDALDGAEQPVEVLMWHGLTGATDDGITFLADQYNAYVRVRQAATHSFEGYDRPIKRMRTRVAAALAWAAERMAVKSSTAPRSTGSCCSGGSAACRPSGWPGISACFKP